MPKVFIVNEPDETRTPAGRPMYDVTPAEQFGQVDFVFKANERSPVQDPTDAVDRAWEVLKEADSDDYLVWAGGDPLGLIIASAVMSDITERSFNYLKWDRAVGNYVAVQIDTN